jgi:hypothetical protein
MQSMLNHLSRRRKILVIRKTSANKIRKEEKDNNMIYLFFQYSKIIFFWSVILRCFFCFGRVWRWWWFFVSKIPKL